MATCLRCGFRAGARNLLLLERTVQEHSCGEQLYRGEERRAFRRWRVYFGGRCQGQLGSTRCVIMDISESGMAVKSTHPRQPGEAVTAAWRFPTDPEPFRITGIVRRVSRDAVGLEFLNISAPDRQRIVQFLSTQPSA